jgi:hypothetical protein
MKTVKKFRTLSSVLKWANATKSDYGDVQWRLGPAVEEMKSALDSVGEGHCKLERDDGENPGREARIHRWVCREMQARTRRCPCGCGSTWDRTVSGTVGGVAAVWGGCSRRSGSATSIPFVGGEEIAKFDAAVESAGRLGLSVDEFVDFAVDYNKAQWQQEKLAVLEQYGL